ncbi:peptide/nickel transport system permease protein [Alkalibacterium subtropicum]|uniref:Peptide/nickel transport system permease protein n=1 Tax=Alkalibacterium subtropicum TaxID=753702 RepID=A0A1I1HPV0_9LACT|nr:ABC transporter permease [Alkalibacterium subtropicum]SFC23040.1 peptide/nickel transport system permease protein [Alkalibacterium subtropicum]
MRSYQTNQIIEQLKFNNGLTWAYSILWLILSIELQPFSFSLPLLLIGAVNLGFSFIHQLLLYRVRQSAFRADRKTAVERSLAALMIFGIVTGNLFTFISGIMAFKKSLSTGLIYSIYMVLVDMMIIAVTSLNLFKPFVTNYYLVGLSVLIITLVYHSLILAFGQKIYSWNPGVQRIALGLLLLSGLTGNLLVFLVAASFYADNQPYSKGKRQTSIREKLTRNHAALLGLLFISFLLTLALTSTFTFSYSFAVQNDYANILQNPSIQYPFGTDNFGRDVFTRIVYGSQISLSVGVLATAIPLLIGGALGAISGFYGRQTDNIIMRLLDILYAIPGLLLAITIVAAFGASTTNLIIALSLGYIPSYARTMRANVLQVTNLEYIDAARALGQNNKQIILKHVIPNAMAPMIVRSTLTIGTAVIATSSLSYLGLGVEAHVPEWGNILRIGSQYLETYPYLAIYPGLAIILLVLSFNFLGDGIRDATDPRLN